jgi:type I restriction enzyme S subunit
MSEWRERRLEDVVRLKRGFDLATRDRRPGPFPVVGSAGISGWHDEGPIPGPALVLGRAGSSMGVASYCETERFWPLNTSLFVEDFKGNDPRFIFHLFQLTDLTGYNSGSAQPMLNRNYIRDVVFLIPGLG